MELRTGEMVTPHLRLVRELGRGGMGSVWVADHLTLQTQVAVKFISFAHGDRQASLARFGREATAAAQIRSPHVVQLFDHGVTADGTPFIVMELLYGESLADRLTRRGTLPLADVAIILKQLAKALSAAHHAGIVHRDIKPENVFCVAQPGAPQEEIFVKLLDFGIARPVAGDASSQVTETGALIGTPAFMSPEQLGDTARIGPATDLWALGVVAYRAICGRLPFHGDTPVSYWRTMTSGTFPLPSTTVTGVPPELDGWFQRAFRVEPNDRFESARAMASALEEMALGPSLTLSTAPRPPSAPVSFGNGQPSDAHADTELAGVATDQFVHQQALGLAAHPSATPGATAPASGHPTPAPHHAPGPFPPATAPSGPAPGTTAGFGAALATGAPRSGPPGGGGRAALLIGGLGLAAAAIALSVWWVGGASLTGLFDGAEASRGRKAASSDSATSRPGLREPALGLKTLGDYHDPKGASISNLKSSSLWAAAARDFAEASKQKGAPVRWKAAHHFAKCQEALVKEALDRGIAACEKAAAMDPKWAAPHSALAGALSRKGDLQGALKEAEAAQRLEPKWWRAVAMSAGAYSRAGKLDEAIQEYRRALELAPDNAVLLGELALMYHAAEMDSEAQRYAERALAADPDLVPVRVMRAERALELQQGKLALTEATRAVSVAPKELAARLAFADAHALLDSRDQAMDEYRKVIELRREGGDQGAPKARLDQIEAALKADRLPPPRHADRSAPNRTRPRAPRSRPSPSKPSRSRPDFENQQF